MVLVDKCSAIIMVIHPLNGLEECFFTTAVTVFQLHQQVNYAPQND